MATAHTETVEDLVSKTVRGLVRIPRFQRGLKWDADDVVKLFDSVSRGFPIGSLLFQQAAAAAERIAIGPLSIDAPESASAWWVVDGQQRLTALTVGLARPEPVPSTPDDPFVIYFDASDASFRSPSKDGKVPSTWVPVTWLRDSGRLTEWVFQWKHARDDALRSAVFDAGRRLREYRVPVYVVASDDEELLREVFYRTNQSGKRLEWTDVHDALFGGSDEHPSTLPQLATELMRVGMGRPDERKLLLPSLMALRGLDVTRSLDHHRHRQPDALRNAVAESVPTLRRVLAFLQQHVRIPHLRLLPRSAPAVVLSRFFALHPEPEERSVELLTRWVWRLLLGATTVDERTLLRRGVDAVDGADEEASVQALLKLVRGDRPPEFRVPARFDARSAESRLFLLAMANLAPRSLTDGRVIDVPALIEEGDVDAFRRIATGSGAMADSPANRMMQPGRGPVRLELEAHIREHGQDTAVLRTLAVTPVAAAHLMKGDIAACIRERGLELVSMLESLSRRLAAWNQNDRPSLDYIMRRVGSEP